MTTSSRKCPECGMEVNGAVLNGQCPSCMIRVMRESDPAYSPEAPQLGNLPLCINLRYFGDYELLGEIGRGGMGVVYRARQLSLNRMVALKLITPEQRGSPKALERFRGEAEAIANLDHPHIIPIYETGEHEGRHYFSMKLIEGKSLAQRIMDLRSIGDEDRSRRKHPSPNLREIAHLLAKVAEAVHYAHQRGILHRDLKPGNILIDAAGEPHVTDFGLARRVGRESQLTLSGEVLGTPAYMAPEQAAGQTRQMTTASDVYSLGVILYEMLAGRLPFQGQSPVETFHAILHNEPASPRSFNAAVPTDLETICQKCLEKESAKRYASAHELAEELRRFARGEPIVARPIGSAARCWRWSMRNPALASALSAVILVFAAGFGGVLWQWQRAEERSRESRRQSYAADMKLAQVALNENNVGRVREILCRHFPNRGEEDLRSIEWRYLWQASQSDELASFPHPAMVNYAILSPDQRLLATACFDQTVRIWDVASKNIISRFTGIAGQDVRKYLAFSPDGKLFASGRPAGVDIRKTENWQIVGRLESDGWAVVFSPDSSLLAVTAPEGVLVWHVDGSETVFLRTGLAMSLRSTVAFFPNSQRLVIGSETDAPAQVWDLSSRSKIGELRGHNRMVSLAISPSGYWIASGNPAGELVLWHSVTRQLIARTQAHLSYTESVAFSPDGKTLATCGQNQLIHLWEVPAEDRNELALKKISTLKGHWNGIWSAQFSQDGRLLVSAGKDHTAKLWPVQVEKDSGLKRVQPNFIFLGISEDGKSFRILTKERMIETWNVADAKVQHLFSIPEEATDIPIFLPNEMIVFGTTNGAVRWYKSDTSQSKNVLQVSEEPVYVVNLSPDDRLLYVVEGHSHTASLWDVNDRKPAAGFPKFKNSEPLKTRVAFSADGRWMACATAGPDIFLWDVRRQRQTAVLKGHRSNIAVVNFSSRGNLLVTSGRDQEIRIWDVPSGNGTLPPLRGRQGTLYASFSGDGQTLVTSGYDGLRLWNVATGREMLFFEDAYSNLAPIISPDGNVMVLRRSNSSMQIIPLPLLADIDAQAKTNTPSM